MADFNIIIRTDTSNAERGIRNVRNSLDNLDGAANRVRGAIGQITGALGALTGAFAFSAAIKSSFEFRDALAEVSTLVNTTTFNLKALEQQALKNARIFGQSPVAQVQAYYSAISAGAASAGEAIEIVDAANRLAIGGVTKVGLALTGLSSIVNAYGRDVLSVAVASDALFVGMRAGQTTIGELSRALGNVTPLAAQVGLSFDELVASVSAITKVGISTASAVTGVRAALSSIAAPTIQAKKLAEELGIEFNSAGLKSKGLVQFLNELVSATGGSSDQIATLFGSIEAVNAIFALSARDGAELNAILADMENKAGSTGDAYEKNLNSPGVQAQRVFQSLVAEITRVVDIFSQALVPVMRLVADNMEAIFDTIVAVGSAVSTYFITLIGIGAIRALGAFVISLTATTIAVNLLSIAIRLLPIGIGLAIGALALQASQANNTIESTEQLGVSVDELRIGFQLYNEELVRVNSTNQEFIALGNRVDRETRAIAEGYGLIEESARDAGVELSEVLDIFEDISDAYADPRDAFLSIEDAILRVGEAGSELNIPNIDAILQQQGLRGGLSAIQGSGATDQEIVDAFGNTEILGLLENLPRIESAINNLGITQDLGSTFENFTRTAGDALAD